MQIRNVVLGFALMATLGLGACAGVQAYDSPKDAREAPVGGDYMITQYHGNLPGVPDSKPAVWTALQYRQLQKLWGDCVEDLGPQLHGTGWKSVAKETTLYAVGDGIGTALGAIFGFPNAKFIQYLKYGIGAGGGNGAAYGYDRHDSAVRYAGGYCMVLQVYWAQIRDHALGGIGVIPNIDSVDTNRVSVPSGSDANSDWPTNDNGQPLPPPPPPPG